jgi:hypothetical protein
MNSKPVPYLALCSLLAVFTCLYGLTFAAGTGNSKDPAEPLRKMLSGSARLNSTIPVEKEILRLRAQENTGALAEFLGHKSHGITCFWALAETGKREHEEKLLEGFSAMPLADRVWCSLWLAPMGTQKVRSALTELCRDKTISADDRHRIRAALLRAGDPTMTKETRAALSDKDADRVARALLLLGDARAADQLVKISGLAGDERKLSTSLSSRFPVKKKEVLKNGWVRETTTYPDLATVGAVALEAASRAVSPTTPEQIAWWYELEKGPRFEQSKDGVAQLRNYVLADERAASSGAPRAGVAIQTVLDHLRKKKSEDLKVRIVSVSFAEVWEIGCVANGESRVVRVAASLEILSERGNSKRGGGGRTAPR